MCEVMSAIAVGSIIAGGALKAYSEYESGQAEADSMKLTAELDRAKAYDAIARGKRDSALARTQGSQANAEATLALAKSGVELTGPMAQNVFATTGMYSELDAQMLEANAAREAWGYQVEEEEANFRRKLAKRRSVLGLAGNVLATAGSAYAAGAGGFGKTGGGAPRVAPGTPRSFSAGRYSTSSI